MEALFVVISICQKQLFSRFVRTDSVVAPESE